MGVLTEDDFKQLDKRFATKSDLAALGDRMEEGFVTNERFSAAIDSLKKRIDQSEQNVTAAIDQAMRNLIHRAEFENLKHRVGTLERKVG